MSNVISDISNAYDIPYCIWHPDVASEDTYRRLAYTNPEMIYQIARACAVAGFNDLYRELDVLPEVHIAEEARECGNMDLFHEIMSKPNRYEVMNDYTKTIDTSSPRVAYLNGDTAVKSSLEEKQRFRPADEGDPDEEDAILAYISPGYRDMMFDITEDMHIDKYGPPYLEREYAEGDAISLLHQPLPLDLPTIDKDLLINMAAYYGNIDRYIRLRRPKMIEGELACCTRGIYHNMMFAVWWETQPRDQYPYTRLDVAIQARFIMNNVLSRWVPGPHHSRAAPYLIWYPDIAKESTYRALARQSPMMIPQILRACIVGDYHDLFDELLRSADIDTAVMLEAKHSRKAHYKTTLDELVRQHSTLHEAAEWKLFTLDDLRKSCSEVDVGITHQMLRGRDPSPYDGDPYDTTCLEIFASVPHAWRAPVDDDGYGYPKVLDYVDWPLDWPKTAPAAAE